MSTTLTLTTGTDRLQGTAGDDTVLFPYSVHNLTAQDVVRLGAGFDVLVTERTQHLGLGGELLAGFSGLDAIDLSSLPSVRFNPVEALLEGSDSGRFTIAFDGDALTLDMRGAGERRGFVLDGTGRVTLFDAENQVVEMARGTPGWIVGGAGADTLIGGGAGDRLLGGAGSDSLVGGGGGDTLSGGEGFDVLVADAGDATLTGGSEGDIFVIGRGAGRVTITDYDVSGVVEHLDLSAFAGIGGVEDLTLRDAGRDLRVTGPGGLDLVLEGAAGAVPRLGGGLDVIRIAAGATTETLQGVISGAPEGAVIELGAGVFDITAPLRIARSDLTIRGAGMDETILRNAIPDDALGPVLWAQPLTGMHHELGALGARLAEGSNRLVVPDGGALSVGDLVFVQQANDDAFLEQIGSAGWDEPDLDDPSSVYLREFRTRVTAVDGDTVTLAEASPYDFRAGVAQVSRSDFLDDLTLSDFSVVGRWGDPDPHHFETTLDAWHAISAIELDGIEDSRLERIGVIDAASHAFRFQRTYEVEGVELLADGAHNKSGSNGYAFMLFEAFRTDLEDIASLGSRHAVLFSARSAEHYNRVDVAFTDRDVNFHGSPDSGNLVTVARMVMDYPDLVLPQWSAVSNGSFPIHTRTDMEANLVLFRELVAGARNDDVTADPQGGDLSTGAGWDTLRGGAGDDTLEGGMGNDVLSGGGGSDRFRYATGDGVDRITDFEAGAGGDVLVMTGTGYTAASQVRWRQEGDTTVIETGQGEAVLLEGVRAGRLTAENVAFADAPAEGIVDTAMGQEQFVLGTQARDVFDIGRPHVESPRFQAALGEGEDMLRLRMRSFDGTIEGIGRLSGVDEIDFRLATRRLDVSLGQGAVRQADEDELTLRVGDRGTTMELDAPMLERGALVIDGARAVQLTGGRSHEVSLGDRVGGTVRGDRGMDVIEGGARGDRIFGMGGNDRIAGNGGADRLAGGAGRDSFVFEIPGTGLQGADRIVDFQPGIDRILIDRPDAFLNDGRIPGAIFAESPRARDAGDMLIYDQASGRLTLDLNGRARGGETVIAVLENRADLDASDVFLI